MIRLILFWIAIASDALMILGLAVSIWLPKYRFWPPPSNTSWQYWLSWITITLASVSVPIVGFLDWESMGAIHWARYFLGAVMLIITAVLLIWSVETLSLHQSLGNKGKLVETGPYRYSRNPQYVALVLLYISVILITSSLLALISGVLLCLVYAATPFSEESWLQDEFGEDYTEYKERVPRFLGFASSEGRGQSD